MQFALSAKQPSSKMQLRRQPIFSTSLGWIDVTETTEPVSHISRSFVKEYKKVTYRQTKLNKIERRRIKPIWQFTLILDLLQQLSLLPSISADLDFPPVETFVFIAPFVSGNQPECREEICTMSALHPTQPGDQTACCFTPFVCMYEWSHWVWLSIRLITATVHFLFQIAVTSDQLTSIKETKTPNVHEFNMSYLRTFLDVESFSYVFQCDSDKSYVTFLEEQ